MSCHSTGDSEDSYVYKLYKILINRTALKIEQLDLSQNVFRTKFTHLCVGVFLRSLKL